MKHRPVDAHVRLLAMAPLLALGGCALHWPWHHHAAAAPEPVHVLTVAPASDGAAVPSLPQSWDRNTLLLDLTGVGAEGTAMLLPGANGWPVRLEFRVLPGALGQLQVGGTQQQTFIVPTQGAPLLLKLSPSVYDAGTRQITLRWSAADGSAR